MAVDLLESESGVTIAEIMAATGWQQHTVRGALAGAIVKKSGRAVSSKKVEGRGRVYRVDPKTTWATARSRSLQRHPPKGGAVRQSRSSR